MSHEVIRELLKHQDIRIAVSFSTTVLSTSTAYKILTLNPANIEDILIFLRGITGSYYLIYEIKSLDININYIKSLLENHLKEKVKHYKKIINEEKDYFGPFKYDEILELKLFDPDNVKINIDIQYASDILLRKFNEQEIRLELLNQNKEHLLKIINSEEYYNHYLRHLDQKISKIEEYMKKT